MHDTDDRNLLLAVARGEQMALDVLVARYAPLVLAACRRQLPGANADDAAQAVFLVLWRRAGRAAAAPSLPGWLVVTARRVCATARRSAVRRQRAEQAVKPSQPAELAGDAAGLLDEALAVLPAAEREVVLRRHLLGEDPGSIAASLGCAEGTVHSRTSRGLERMRIWFSRRGIVCTVPLIVLAFDGARAAAADLVPLAAATCSAPSARARMLAHAYVSVVTFRGALMMSTAVLAGLVCAGLVLLGAPATSASAADASETVIVRLYDITDIYQQETVVWEPVMAMGNLRSGDGVAPPPSDPGTVGALDAARRLRDICERIETRAGPGAHASMVDIGMSEEDLEASLPEGLLLPRDREAVRLTLAGIQPRIPGLDAPRTMLLASNATGHARIQADLAAIRDQRRARLLAEPGMEAVIAAAQEAVMGPGGPHPPVLPRRGSAPFVVIWLPEEPSQVRPFAVACDGRRSLLLHRQRIVCRPDLRPAAMALALRHGLDRGAIPAPLTADAWSEVAAQAIIDLGERAPFGPFYARLAGTHAQAVAPAADGF